MGRWEKRDQDLHMKAGDNHMKINIGNHELKKINISLWREVYRITGEKRYEE